MGDGDESSGDLFNLDSKFKNGGITLDAKVAKEGFLDKSNSKIFFFRIGKRQSLGFRSDLQTFLRANKYELTLTLRLLRSF